MTNAPPSWFMIPLHKDLLNNMRYDGDCMQRHKKIKKFLPFFYESVMTAASQSKTKYTYTGKEFHSDIFISNDKKMKEDLIPILHVLFPGSSIFYSESFNPCGTSISKSICVDWSIQIP